MKKIIFLIALIFLTGCTIFNFKEDTKSKYLEMTNLIDEIAFVDTYTIYGKYFNLSGEISLECKNLSLVLKNEEEELEYDLITKIKDNKTKFLTNELINEGIDLETIKIGEYVILLKNDDKYYTLKNKTDYLDLEYYTITKNKENRKISISFETLADTPFLYLNSSDTKLPADIYDIVIDPGHGGSDSGAVKNGYFESHINLDYAKMLKEELEKLGLKVKLTRDDDSNIATYGESGRVSIPYQTKAKLMLSIHMNSAINNVGRGGVEIYIPNQSDPKFASSLAKNIVGFTSSNYSSNVSNKVLPGVYLRTLSKTDLNNIKEEAEEKGYKPYERATLESTYYYIIRETGGIITNAYVDSRNLEKEWNHDYNSNHGCETYLLELGYMNSSSNLEILLTEKDEYIKAIILSIREYLEL